MNANRTWKVVLASVIFGLGIILYFYVMIPGNFNRDSFVSSGENIMSTQGPAAQGLEAALETDAEGLSKAVVVLQTTRGTVKYKFYTKDAPKTVHRIAELISKGFYNDLSFHRVVPGFVIQGGDPTGTGAGGSGMKLPAEFNSRKHVLGTVSMARAMDPNSADSQFYIMLGVHPHLDGQYTVFGQVISGQDVVNQIQQGDRMVKVTLEY
jgi:cyclophilin family peptidyl-prolyl cis-trans isomerase